MGAYDFYFRKDFEPDSETERYHLGVLAVQKLLQYNGRYREGELDGVFGGRMHKAVVRFQGDAGLGADGVVGPNTCRALFVSLIAAVERQFDIPFGYLCGLVKLESLFDPVATGWADPDDRGVAQINRRFHPDVSDEEAFDPDFAINWAGKHLKDAYASYKDDCPKRAWRAAILQHNRPKSSSEYCSGGWGAIEATADRTADEEQARCKQYVALVSFGC